MRTRCLGLATMALVALAGGAPPADAQGQRAAGGSWKSDFAVDKSELSATGRSPYFVLEPGYQLVLEGGRERLTITVLDEVKSIDGVSTRVVEEREAKDGKLVEVSRNYFAINSRTLDVFYFGEDVDIYKDGQVVEHEGAWQSGANGARFGLFLPGDAALRARFYQEIAPKVAMDRVEIVDLARTVRTPAGEFANCLVLKETSPLEPFTHGYKYFVKGIGLVQDGSAKLVSHGMAAARAR